MWAVLVPEHERILFLSGVSLRHGRVLRSCGRRLLIFALVNRRRACHVRRGMARTIVYVRRADSKWHVARRDGHAVCGMWLDPHDVLVVANETGVARDTCKSCLRMKDAYTAQVARSLEEARG